MLSRLIFRPSNLRLVTLTTISSSSNLISYSLTSSNLYRPIPNPISLLNLSRPFSKDNRSGSSNDKDKDPSVSQSWTLTPDPDESSESVFGSEEADISGIADEDNDEISTVGSQDEVKEGGDIFEDIDREFRSGKGGGDEWETAEGYVPWSFGDEGKDGVGSEGKDVFEVGGEEGGGIEGLSVVGGDEVEAIEDDKRFEEEEQVLSATLKGPNRAFGDLIAASGITEAMLDSLIALKDLEGVEGLPPLREIEDMRLEKNERKSTRAEIERKKQEDIAKARVRQVDEKGRAYGTGRRKCSIARVWIEPGNGKFIVNDKEFDAYFPDLDKRSDLLRPFVETKTLGLWDVHCTVKGGGISGQAGAIRLGVSRALQNWEPGLRPPLRAAGYLTRDSRVVERKKPGKAKARKSFQWVKR